VPPVTVIGVTLGLVAGVVGMAAGVPWLGLALIVPAAYLLLILAAAVRCAARNGVRAALWYLIVLPCIHFGWGIGFLLGFLGLTRNITEHTGR
jgi:hypothetical protein